MSKGRILAGGAAVLVAALLANWLVIGPRNLAQEFPATTYRGLSQRAFFAAEAAWSRLHGIPSYGQCKDLDNQTKTVMDACWSRKNIQESGRFYAWFVGLVCPLAGFGIFLAFIPSLPWFRLWLPLAIAALAAAVRVPYLRHSPETYSVLVVLAMIASISVFMHRAASSSDLLS